MDNEKRLTIRLNPRDNVVVARKDLSPGMEIFGEGVLCLDEVLRGHKLATEQIPRGSFVIKYGQVIGAASRDIAKGEHVHTHNLQMIDFQRDYVMEENTQERDCIPEYEQAVFSGIMREDGQVATRNYIGVLAVSGCAATVVRLIADSFRVGTLDRFPNIDGVVSLAPSWGCGMASSGEGFEYLRRCLEGYIRHPNFGAVVLVGLGCEVNQVNYLIQDKNLHTDRRLQTMTIQESGGTRKTMNRTIGLIEQMLPEVNRVERRPIPASRLVLGLECGGSDAYSGITANPALGAAADILVRHGGTAVLSETPEIYGAEHLLAGRAKNSGVGVRLMERIRWWEEYARMYNNTIDNNPAPGNKAGGLSTILEKSLGAVAKGGTTTLMEVYGYGEPVRTKGLVFMDTPGYDLVSNTGLIAGGAHIICFTTGCGSVIGCKPTPVIKLASNTQMFERLAEDMDINCGPIADGDATIDEMGESIFRFILQTASGTKNAE